MTAIHNPLFNQSLLLQLILSKSLTIASELQTEKNLFDYLVEPVHASTFNWQPFGSVRKMQLYFSQLMDSCEELPPPSFHQIGHSLQELLLCATTLEPCKEKIASINTCLISHLLEGCKTIQRDPTLCLFLWCRHETFDTLLGKGSIASFFFDCFEQKLELAHDYLSTSYAKKGYTHLLPTIKENYLSLQSCFVTS